MKVTNENRIPIKSWCPEIEEGAMAQANNLANLPFAFRHIALMPDCHQGYGMPIGGVMATEGVVIPNAVGMDIGCGMRVIQTNIKEGDFKTDTLKEIMGEIRKQIPVGFEHHKEVQREDLGIKNYGKPFTGPFEIIDSQKVSASKQLGTLGGGNHFIEIQKGNGFIWIMIHSGSRNLGYKVAKHYNKVAVDLNKKWYSSIPYNQELAFLPLNTDEAKHYLEEMGCCLEFAKSNRELMMEKIKKIFLSKIKCEFQEEIDVHHNYAVMENHFGKNVMIHRKGATSAKKGQIGIIPGSQGTSSYIVKGLGNVESFNSCSHGAGRTMGRKDACRRLDLKEEQEKLNKQGIVHSVRNVSDLEEAPSAYKDIGIVMKNQEDLVEIVVELKPLGVIKG